MTDATTAPELEPPPTEPTPVNPDEVFGRCRSCRVDVTAKNLAAAFKNDVYVCRKCDGNHGEPD